jgi:glycine cleavage system H protein
VLEVNGEAGEKPELINDDPYGSGWMVRVKLSDPGEVESLLDVEAYKQLLSDEN